MKSGLSLTLVVCLIGWTVPVSAQETSRETTQGRITRAAVSEAVRLALTTQPPATVPSGQRQKASQTWIHRHPAATGALIGLGIGFAIGAATCTSPFGDQGTCDAFTYPAAKRMFGGITIGGIGAGIGAGVGAVIGARPQ